MPRVSHWLVRITIVLTAAPAVISLIAIVPRVLRGSLDGGSTRVGLWNAYLFFAFAAPIGGAIALAANFASARMTRSPTGDASPARVKWMYAAPIVAVASGILWFALFPFVFFATGGSR